MQRRVKLAEVFADETHVTPQEILSEKYISNRWSSSVRASLNERVRGIIIGVEDRTPVAFY